MKNTNRGFTLIELMIATTLATLMSYGVLSIYINQSGTLSAESQRDATAQEANRAFDIISRLLRQAQLTTMTVTNGTFNDNNTPETSGDSAQIDFLLPENQNIWPNTNGGPNNAVRLSWNNTNTNNSYKIQIANAATIADLSSSALNVIAGSNTGKTPRVINMDVWPLSGQQTKQANVNDPATNGYLLRITTRSAEKDISYTNPNVTSGDYKNYRTYTVSGIISPRN